MNQSQEIAPEADRVMINHAREIIEGFTRRNTQRISEILVFETRRQLENSSQYVSDTTVWSSEYHMRIRDAYGQIAHHERHGFLLGGNEKFPHPDLTGGFPCDLFERIPLQNLYHFCIRLTSWYIKSGKNNSIKNLEGT